MTGTKTEITEVVVPTSAQVGASVSVQVKVKNITDSTVKIMAGGALGYGVIPWPAISFTTEAVEVAAGETQTFSGSFIMPESDVVVHGYSYYYDETEEVWYFDDEATNGVTAVQAPSILDILLPLMVLAMMVPIVIKSMR